MSYNRGVLKLLIALAVVIAMPVSQLRTVMVVKACCCPDPDRCHCPDHDASTSSQPSMRACHTSSQAVVAPVLPAFVAPSAVAIVAPSRVPVASVFVLAIPHPSPPPARPAAPS